MNLSWRGGEYSQDDAAKTSPQFSNEAIKLLKKGVPEVLESAMSLIRLFSMLDCDSINETMIKRMYYPDVDNLMDTWEPVFVPRVATHCEGMRFLQKHNIVFAVKDDSIHVNQKVATAVRAQMIKEGIFTKWFETSYKLVAASFPQTGFATLGMLYRFPRKEAGDKVVRHVFCLNKHYLKHFALKPQSQELGVSLEPLRHVKIARTLYESGQCMVELSRPFEAKFILDEAEKILGGVMGLPNIEETSRQAAKNLRLYISTSRMWLALLLNTEILLEPPEQYPLHMIVAKHNSGMRELQMKNYNEAYVLFSELREFLNPGFHQTWICTLKYHMALVRLRQLENEIAKATSNFEEARNYFEEADSLLDELVTLEKASNSIISDSSMWLGKLLYAQGNVHSTVDTVPEIGSPKTTEEIVDLYNAAKANILLHAGADHHITSRVGIRVARYIFQVDPQNAGSVKHAKELLGASLAAFGAENLDGIQRGYKAYRLPELVWAYQTYTMLPDLGVNDSNQWRISAFRALRDFNRATSPGVAERSWVGSLSYADLLECAPYDF